MDSNPWDADKMLKRYIYDYLIKKNMHVSAQTFKEEVDIPLGPVVIDDSQGGFLSEWWQIFSDFYSSRMKNNSGDPPATFEASRVIQGWSNRVEANGPSASHCTPPSPVLRKPPPLQVGGSSCAPFRNVAPKEDSVLHQQLNEDRWGGLPEYLRCMIPELQNSSNNVVGRNSQPVGMQRPQQMEFKRPRVTSSVQVRPHRPPKINVPVIGLPDPVPFRPANPAPPNPWSANVLNTILIPRNQGQQFRPLSYQEEQNIIQRSLPQARGTQRSNGFADPALLGNLRGGVTIGDAQKEASMEMIAQVNPGGQLQKDRLKGKQVEEFTGKRKEPSYTENQSNHSHMDIEGLSHINLSPQHTPYYESVSDSLTEAFECIQSRDFFTDDKNKKLVQRSKSSDDLIDLNDVSLEDHVENWFFPEGEKNDNAKTSSDDLINVNDVSLEDHVENLFFPEGDKNENAKTSSDDLIDLNDGSLENHLENLLLPEEEKNKNVKTSSPSKHSSKESEGEKNENAKSSSDSTHSSEEYEGDKNGNAKTQSDSKHSSASAEESEGEKNENAKTSSDSKNSSASVEETEGEKNENAQTQSDSKHSSTSTEESEGEKTENAKSSSDPKQTSHSTDDSEGDKIEKAKSLSASKHGFTSIEESEGKKNETAIASPDLKHGFSIEESEGKKNETAIASSDSKHGFRSIEESEGKKNETAISSSDSKHGSTSIEESEGKKNETPIASADEKKNETAIAFSDSKHGSASIEESEGKKNETAISSSDSNHGSTSIEESEGKKNETPIASCDEKKNETAIASSDSKHSSTSTEETLQKSPSEENRDAAKDAIADHVPEEKDQELQSSASCLLLD